MFSSTILHVGEGWVAVKLPGYEVEMESYDGKLSMMIRTDEEIEVSTKPNCICGVSHIFAKPK